LTLKGSIGYQIQSSNIEPKKVLTGTPLVINVSFINKFCHFSNKKNWVILEILNKKGVNSTNFLENLAIFNVKKILYIKKNQI
jgi:hypothetical protein